MGLGSFIKKTVKKVEETSAEFIGGSVGLIDEDLGEDLDSFLSDYGLEVALLAYGIPAAGGWASGIAGGGTAGAVASGLVQGQLWSAGLNYLGTQEQIKLQEENAARMAEYEREVAALQAREVRDRGREERGQALVEASSTGAFTGERSFSPGTGLGSVLATNRARALDLSKRLLQRGERKAGMITDEAKRSARAGKISNLFSLGAGAFSAYTSGVTAATAAKRGKGTSTQGTEISS